MKICSFYILNKKKFFFFKCKIFKINLVNVFQHSAYIFLKFITNININLKLLYKFFYLKIINTL
jgi:hypothetical protein